MHFNKLNEMGTQEENQKLRNKRENERKVRPISKIKIWDIWNKLSRDIDEVEDEFTNEDLDTKTEIIIIIQPLREYN